MSTTPPKLSPGLKLGLDLGPLVIFFILLMRVDIYAATISYMVLGPLTAAIYWFYERKIPPMLLVNTTLILVMGGLTIVLQDDTFIKMKPTLVYSLFAVVLSFGLMTGRLFIKMIMETSIQMQDQGWRRMTLGGIALFIGLAVANEFIWRNYSDGVWAVFKIAVIPITLVAFGLIFFSCSKFVTQAAENTDDKS